MERNERELKKWKKKREREREKKREGNLERKERMMNKGEEEMKEGGIETRNFLPFQDFPMEGLAPRAGSRSLQKSSIEEASWFPFVSKRGSAPPS